MQKISDFINDALFNPLTGYYRKKNPIGKDADFITAPEISQVFGELIAVYFLQIAATKNSKIAFVEMGAGKGTLFKDILSTIKKLADKKNQEAINFLKNSTFHIIEISEALTEIQQKNLQESEVKISWHKNFKSFLNSEPQGEIFFLANELFDCFAIDQYIKIIDGWHERIVVEVQGKKQFTLADFSQKMHDFVEEKLGKTVSNEAPLNAVFEYSVEAKNFMQELCENIKNKGGLALLIDYGYVKREFANTLQAIKNHKKCSVLENVGESDITSLVDFSLLKTVVSDFNLNSSLISQREFLLALGVEERRKTLLLQKSQEEQKEINSAIDRLIDSSEMGDLFKCLIFWK